MPAFMLHVKLEMENVAKASLKANSYCINLKEGAGFETRDGVHVDRGHEAEIPGSKGNANFVMKWKESKRECTISIVDVKGATRDITEDDNEKWVPIAVFECRGCEPTGYQPEGEWLVESTKGTKFEDVDLSDEWTDYCEKLGESVSIMKLESKFELRRAK
ncbi:hypothetical protein FOA52_002934 [Chlamydomonas sp. UWO 241]|nr:hypothetical protein FOA52_002934 [Chlamydomonas sp. UWO 241]